MGLGPCLSASVWPPLGGYGNIGSNMSRNAASCFLVVSLDSIPKYLSISSDREGSSFCEGRSWEVVPGFL